MQIEKALDVLKRLRVATATSNIDGDRILDPLSMAIQALEKQSEPYIRIGDEVIMDGCEDETYIVTDVRYIYSYRNDESRFECSLKYKDCDMNLSNSIGSDRLIIV